MDRLVSPSLPGSESRLQVSLAMELVKDPRLLFLDEPTRWGLTGP